MFTTAPSSTTVSASGTTTFSSASLRPCSASLFSTYQFSSCFCIQTTFQQAAQSFSSASSGALPVFYALIACGLLIGIATTPFFVLWLYLLFWIATRRTMKEIQR